MSIFEKWFSGGESKESETGGIPEKSDAEKKEWNLKEDARLLNIFIAGYRMSIGPEFVGAVIKEAGLTEQEVKDMQVTAYDKMLNNGLSISANEAYMNSVRNKIIKAIKKMDVGELVE